MDFASYFPIWEQLTAAQKADISAALLTRQVPKGEIVHNGSLDCTGLFLVGAGQLRAYILSQEGREITVYRLFERDMCLLSASCMLRSISFDITIQAEKDTQMWIIPTQVYQRIMQESAPVANFTNELMATRFSDVMWLLEQIMWKSLDKRLAAFLLEESAIEESQQLTITHEIVANHLGSPREVITRLLRYFQSEGMVKLSRGKIALTDIKKLQQLDT